MSAPTSPDHRSLLVVIPAYNEAETIEEVARRMPYMRTDDLIEACYCPTDGHLQPAELVSAYIKVGKKSGVRFISN